MSDIYEEEPLIRENAKRTKYEQITDIYCRLPCFFTVSPAFLGFLVGTVVALLVFYLPYNVEPSVLDQKTQLTSSILASAGSIFAYAFALLLPLFMMAPIGRGKEWTRPKFPVKNAVCALFMLLILLSITTLGAVFLFCDRSAQSSDMPRAILTAQNCIDGLVPLLLWGFEGISFADTKWDFCIILVLWLVKVPLAIVIHFVANDNYYFLYMDLLNMVYCAVIIIWVIPGTGLLQRAQLLKQENYDTLRYLFSLWQYAIAFRYAAKLGMLVFINFVWVVYKLTGNPMPSDYSLYDEWIDALWVWLIDTFPLVLIWLCITATWGKFLRVLRFYAMLNIFVLMVFLSAAIIDIIADSAAELNLKGSSLLYYWFAKFGAKWLLCAVTYEMYIGLRATRTWLNTNYLEPLSLQVAMSPGHTVTLPVIMFLLVTLHILGWSLAWIFGNQMASSYIVAIVTGSLVIVFTIFLIIANVLKKLMKIPHSTFRKIHWIFIVLAFMLLLVHGWKSLSGVPYFWAVVMIAVTFTIFELFHSQSIRIESQTALKPRVLLEADGVTLEMEKSQPTENSQEGEEEHLKPILKEEKRVKGGIYVVTYTMAVHKRRFFVPGMTIIVKFTQGNGDKVKTLKLFRQTDSREYSVVSMSQTKDKFEIQVHINTDKRVQSALYVENIDRYDVELSPGYWGSFGTVKNHLHCYSLFLANGVGIAPLCGLLLSPVGDTENLDNGNLVLNVCRRFTAVFAESDIYYLNYIRLLLQKSVDQQNTVEFVMLDKNSNLDEALALVKANRCVIFSACGSATPWTSILNNFAKERKTVAYLAGSVSAIYQNVKQSHHENVRIVSEDI